METRTYIKYSQNVFKQEQNTIHSTLTFLNNSDNILNVKTDKSKEIKDLLKSELDIKDIPKIKTIEINKEFVFIIPNQIEIKEVHQIDAKVHQNYEINNPKFQFLFDPYLEEEISPVIEEKIDEIPPTNSKFDINGNIESEEVYSNKDLISMLNYNNSNNRLFDIINTFDKYVNNHNDKFNILKEVYKLTHKRMINGNKLTQWIENYPNLIDNKIKAIQNKLKKKNKNPNRVKATIQNYYSPNVSELRFKTVNRMLESRGYIAVNSDLIYDRIRELHKSLNLDIVKDIILNLPKEVDNDMLEFDENKQFQDYIKDCEMRYKDHE